MSDWKETRANRRRMIAGMRKKRLLNLKRAIENSDDDIRSLSKTWSDSQTPYNLGMIERERAYRDKLVAKFYEVKQNRQGW